MLLIRRFEEKTVELYQRGLMGGSLHTYTGQEAVAAGCCLALRPTDYISITYRGRGHALAKGADPGRVLAEMLGRIGGYCRGKGGPMHLTAMEVGLLGANGIVAGGIPMAVGAALAAQMQREDRVAAAFFGDGATNQGVFHEALNLAAVWRLPVIFVCENNQYSEMTPLRQTVAVAQLAERARGNGLPAVVVDGNDALAVYAAMREAVARARAGQGPTFIEAMTYRTAGHMLGDAETYRTREEVEAWRQRDPIKRLAERLREAGASESLLAEVDREVQAVVAAAEQFALASPVPPITTVEEDLWATPAVGRAADA